MYFFPRIAMLNFSAAITHFLSVTISFESRIC